MKTTVSVAGVEITGELSDVTKFLATQTNLKSVKIGRKRRKRKAKAASGRPRKKRKYTKRAAYWKKDAA